MNTILRRFCCRLWPRRRAQQGRATTAVHVQSVLVLRPIPLAERQPEPDDLGGLWDNHCWWGHWQGDHWLWIWDSEPVRGETHWLPASVPVLPASIYPDREVQP